MEKENIEEKIIDIEIEKSNLENLKEEYEKLEEKTKLPDFDKLNEDFSIDKINSEETAYLEREIRRNISDKFSNYLKLIETFIQPSNAHMFVFSMIKKLNRNDTEILHELYKKISLKEMEVLELDLIYNKEKEINFIKESFDVWQEVKNKLLPLLEKMRNSTEEHKENNSRNYFG